MIQQNLGGSSRWKLWLRRSCAAADDDDDDRCGSIVVIDTPVVNGDRDERR